MHLFISTCLLVLTVSVRKSSAFFFGACLNIFIFRFPYAAIHCSRSRGLRNTEHEVSVLDTSFDTVCSESKIFLGIMGFWPLLLQLLPCSPSRYFGEGNPLFQFYGVDCGIFYSCFLSVTGTALSSC